MILCQESSWALACSFIRPPHIRCNPANRNAQWSALLHSYPFSPFRSRTDSPSMHTDGKSLFPSVCLSLSVSVCLCVCLRLSVCPSVCLSVCLSVSLSLSLQQIPHACTLNGNLEPILAQAHATNGNSRSELPPASFPG